VRCIAYSGREASASWFRFGFDQISACATVSASSKGRLGPVLISARSARRQDRHLRLRGDDSFRSWIELYVNIRIAHRVAERDRPLLICERPRPTSDRSKRFLCLMSAPETPTHRVLEEKAPDHSHDLSRPPERTVTAIPGGMSSRRKGIFFQVRATIEISPNVALPPEVLGTVRRRSPARHGFIRCRLATPSDQLARMSGRVLPLQHGVSGSAIADWVRRHVQYRYGRRLPTSAFATRPHAWASAGTSPTWSSRFAGRCDPGCAMFRVRPGLDPPDFHATAPGLPWRSLHNVECTFDGVRPPLVRRAGPRTPPTWRWRPRFPPLPDRSVRQGPASKNGCRRAGRRARGVEATGLIVPG